MYQSCSSNGSYSEGIKGGTVGRLQDQPWKTSDSRKTWRPVVSRVLARLVRTEPSVLDTGGHGVYPAAGNWMSQCRPGVLVVPAPG